MQNNLKASLYILNTGNYRESVKIHGLVIYTIKRKYIVSIINQTKAPKKIDVAICKIISQLTILSMFKYPIMYEYIVNNRDINTNFLL